MFVVPGRGVGEFIWFIFVVGAQGGLRWGCVVHSRCWRLGDERPSSAPLCAAAPRAPRRWSLKSRLGVAARVATLRMHVEHSSTMIESPLITRVSEAP